MAMCQSQFTDEDERDLDAALRGENTQQLSEELRAEYEKFGIDKEAKEFLGQGAEKTAKEFVETRMRQSSDFAASPEAKRPATDQEINKFFRDALERTPRQTRNLIWNVGVERVENPTSIGAAFPVQDIVSQLQRNPAVFDTFAKRLIEKKGVKITQEEVHKLANTDKWLLRVRGEKAEKGQPEKPISVLEARITCDHELQELGWLFIVDEVRQKWDSQFKQLTSDPVRLIRIEAIGKSDIYDSRDLRSETIALAIWAPEQLKAVDEETFQLAKSEMVEDELTFIREEMEEGGLVL